MKIVFRAREIKEFMKILRSAFNKFNNTLKLSLCGLFWKNLRKWTTKWHGLFIFIIFSFFFVPGSSWKVASETGYTANKQTKETLINIIVFKLGKYN